MTLDLNRLPRSLNAPDSGAVLTVHTGDRDVTLGELRVSPDGRSLDLHLAPELTPFPLRYTLGRVDTRRAATFSAQAVGALRAGLSGLLSGALHTPDAQRRLALLARTGPLWVQDINRHRLTVSANYAVISIHLPTEPA